MDKFYFGFCNKTIWPLFHYFPAYTVYDDGMLKNLINEAGKRLISEHGKNEAEQIIKKLKDFASEIDHNYNLDSLVIFVSSDFFEFIRLPVKVKDSVIIDDKFAAKSLLRSMLQTKNYYIICLSRKIVRIIEAVNDTAVAEINDGSFPLKNDAYIDSDDVRKSWASTTDNYAKEFFHKADKLFKVYYGKNPKPVILAGDVRNICYYKEITDKRDVFIGYIVGNYDNLKAHEIVKHARSIIDNFIRDEQGKAIEELALAKKEKKLLLGINDIYLAANYFK